MANSTYFESRTLRSTRNSSRFTSLTNRFPKPFAHRPTIIEQDSDLRGRSGLITYTDPKDVFVELIFVQGFPDGSRSTWTAGDDPKTFWPLWLSDWPEFEHVRVHTYGHNADWHGKVNLALFHDLGLSLLESIVNSGQLKRKSNAFSITKQDPKYYDLGKRFCALVFLATPHRGGIVNVLRLDNNDAESATVVSEQIHEAFRHNHGGARLISFYEQLPTSRNTSELTVDSRAATLGFANENAIPIGADHLRICKFPNADHPSFTLIRETMATTVEELLREMHDPDTVEDQMRKLAGYLGVSDSEEDELINLENLEVEGSCSWLLEKKSFVAWRGALQAADGDEDENTSPRSQSLNKSGHQAPHEPNRYFWLTGPPGAGKTVLAGHVVRHLRDHRCYYYFLKHADKSRQNASGLLKSLAFQIARHDLFIRQSFLEMQVEGNFTAETQDMRTIWKQLFVQRIFRTSLLQPQFWVIDGFDNAHGGNELLPLLAKIPTHLPINIFLTSRRDAYLEKQIARLPVSLYHISVQDTIKDIRLYLQENKDDLPVSQPQAVEELILKLVDKSQGSFLWTRLILERLQDAWTDVAIDNALESIPEGLQEMYMDILERMAQNDESNVKLAQAVLRWATCSACPLTTVSLQDAIRLDIGQKVEKLEQMLESVCGQLVFVNEQGRIQLVHDTARDFLLACDLNSPFAIDKARTHERIAQICLRYLTDDTKVKPTRRPLKASQEVVSETFREYANLYFSEHLVKCSQDVSQGLMARLENFFDNKALTWVEYIAREKKDISQLTQTAKNLKRFAEQRANWSPPLSPGTKILQDWATDLIRLVTAFGNEILYEPSIIHRVIPPLCPASSIVHRRFGNQAHGLEVVGLGSYGWNERIYSTSFARDEATSLACCDRRYAIGLRSGVVVLCYSATCQEANRIETGAAVRFLEFAKSSSWLVVCGKWQMQMWNYETVSKIWAVDLSFEPITVCLPDDEETIMMATKQNMLVYFNTVDGSVTSQLSWSGHGQDRPPKRIFLSVDMDLLALVYRNQDIMLFELGSLDRPRMLSVDADVQVIAFNPALNMLAIGYFEGDLCTIGMWNIHRPVTKTEADASHLAVSSDGRTLIVGTNTGSIQIRDFDTLNIMHVINFDEEEPIVSMIFTINGLRFLDARRSEFNIWEPSVLVRRKDQDDSTSEGLTSYSTAPSELVQAYTQGEHKVITAMVPDQTGEYVFCGKENGTVAVFGTQKGKQLKELFQHSNNSVISLDWNAETSIIVSSDSTSRILVHKLREIQTRRPSGHRFEWTSQKIAAFHAGQAINQLFLSGSGYWFLGSSLSGQAHAWTQDGELVPLEISQRKNEAIDSTKRWMVHPRSRHKLIGVGKGYAQVHRYEEGQRSMTVDSIAIDASHRVDNNAGSFGFHFIEFANGIWAAYDDNPSSRPIAWTGPESVLSTSSVTEAALDYFKQSLSGIKDLLGLYRAKIVFADFDGWICSLSLEQADSERRLARHFPIPHCWQSTRHRMIATVTVRGDVIIAKGDELAIVKRGLTAHI